MLLINPDESFSRSDTWLYWCMCVCVSVYWTENIVSMYSALIQWICTKSNSKSSLGNRGMINVYVRISWGGLHM